MRTRAILLAFVLFVPALAGAQDLLLQTARDLKARAEKTIAAADTYLGEAGSPGADVSEVASYRQFVRELRVAMTDVLNVTAPLVGSGTQQFDMRFAAPQSVGELVDRASRGRLDRFIPLQDGLPPCCDELTSAQAPREHAFATALAEIWKGFGPAQLEASIKDVSEVYDKFEAKLLKGFPGMPWEYMLNFQGDRNGPSPHQIIWAHPSLGFEFDDLAAEGASQLRPVLTLQVLGYNRYFFKGLNYVGVAGILTVNATEGRDRFRKGGAVHFGNLASVGMTHGDDRWMLFIASDRLGDKLVGALVKMR